MKIKSILIKQYQTDSMSEDRLVLIQAANSVIMYLCAFFIMLIVYQVMTSITATTVGVSNTLYLSEINFDNFHGRWGRFNVIAIYSAGPLSCIMLGLASLMAFNKLSRTPGHLKIFLLWMVLHGINFFFGALIAGAIVKGGFGYVPSWASKNSIMTYILAGLSVFPLLIMGVIAARPFIQLVPRLDILEREEMPRFCFRTIFWPYFVTIPLVCLIIYPNYNIYLVCILILMIFILFPAYLIAIAPRTTSTGVAREPNVGIAWKYLVVLSAMVLVGKFVEVFGIVFIR